MLIIRVLKYRKKFFFIFSRKMAALQSIQVNFQRASNRRTRLRRNGLT